MKATIEFDLPDEEERFDMALRGQEFSSSLDEIYNICRQYLKYGYPDCTIEDLILRIKDISAIY